MKIFMMVFIVLFLISSPFFAQSISVKRVEEIRTEEPAYYPQFSPDGSKIYFSTENYKGLRELDLNSNSERIITDDFGAGYDFSFSSDGQNIFYRSDNFENPKKRSSIIAFNLISNSQNKIVSNGTEVSTPVFEKDKLVIGEKGETKFNWDPRTLRNVYDRINFTYLQILYTRDESEKKSRLELFEKVIKDNII